MKNFCKWVDLSLQNKKTKALVIMKIYILLSIVTTFAVSASIYSQPASLSLSVEGKTLKEALKIIEGESPYRFFYSDDFQDLENKVTLTIQNESIASVMESLLRNSTIGYRILENNVVVITPDAKSLPPQNQVVKGSVTDAKTGEPLPGVNVFIQGTTVGTITDATGNFSLEAKADKPVVVFSCIGYVTKEVIWLGQDINISLESDTQILDEVLVVGYGVQKKESVTGAISNATLKDLSRVNTTSINSSLAGKIAGLSYRMTDGSPGAYASIQVRNLGNPLYVIDGIQSSVERVNSLSPNDVESITVLKDASAAIYGVRAANGVILVTTKKGRLEKPVINIDTYWGWDNWSRAPRGGNAYQYMLGMAESDLNRFGETGITEEELDKWKDGTEEGYKSFDWYDFVVQENAPHNSFNINTTGGNENVNYYVSLSRLYQTEVIGREQTFERINLQSNVTANIKRFKVGIQLSGSLDDRKGSGIQGGSGSSAVRYGLYLNSPTTRPYANDNPKYVNNIPFLFTNLAVLPRDISGYNDKNRNLLTTNISVEYEFPIKGLTARGLYSYQYSDMLRNMQQFRYNAYTYFPGTDTYEITGRNEEAQRLRESQKLVEKVLQGQLNYNNTFGKHTIGATYVVERYEMNNFYHLQRATPVSDYFKTIGYNETNSNEYTDLMEEQARIGYIGRLTYNFANRYYLELSGRYDGSWKFAPDKRWGFFPSASVGWRITEENFMKNWMGSNSPLTFLKLRASYGILGDDNVGIGPFDYLSGYTYATSFEYGMYTVLDGTGVLGARDRGAAITNISWFTSNMFDAGIDFAFLNGKLSGSLDYFKRVREGLVGHKYDILVPSELGYTLPDENVNSDAQVGADGSIQYNGKIRSLTFSVGTNVSFSRDKWVSTYKPMFGNSLDQYYNSVEDRWKSTYWGYKVIGRFTSLDDVNNYTVNNDEQGNATMLPGDFKYKDVNDDGLINGFDMIPIGYGTEKQPMLNVGLNLTIAYKGFDLSTDFSGGSLYSFEVSSESRIPGLRGGCLLTTFEDRWHREDIYDINSNWVEGEYPAIRYNDRRSTNAWTNSYWVVNVKYFRLRTLEFGYTFPAQWMSRVKIQRARLFLNTYNLFSIDNMKKYDIDPETGFWPKGILYPQNKYVNIGFNVSF